MPAIQKNWYVISRACSIITMFTYINTVQLTEESQPSLKPLSLIATRPIFNYLEIALSSWSISPSFFTHLINLVTKREIPKSDKLSSFWINLCVEMHYPHWPTAFLSSLRYWIYLCLSKGKLVSLLTHRPRPILSKVMVKEHQADFDFGKYRPFGSLARFETAIMHIGW